MNKVAIFIGILVLFSSCQETEGIPKRFQLLSPEESGIDFVNAVDPEKVNILDYVNMYNGSGVGIGDFNNDGFQDVFLGGNMETSRLYLNTGKNQKISFFDVTAKSGTTTDVWVNGITVTDINQDGWLDIYCSASAGKLPADRTNKLFVNQGINEEGIPTFREQARDYGLADSTHTIQSTFFDYDSDGDLDVFMIVNYPTGYLDAEANRIFSIKKRGNPNRTDRLYQNQGIGPNGHPVFLDVSETAGITLEGFSLGLGIHDFNNDNLPDIYVANDYVSNDILYINNGDGTFTDRIRDYVGHTSYSSMGMDIADINNDGLQDFMVLDMLPEADNEVKLMYSATAHNSFGLMQKMNYVDQYFRNTLQLNNGYLDTMALKYSEIGQMLGVHATHWSWSVLMPDLDLDGWRDIFITNGFSKDVNNLDFINYEQPTTFVPEKFDGEAYVESLKGQKGICLPNYIYSNRGDLTFEDVSSEWGILHPSYSNGAAYADFDNDGDLDLVVNNINDSAFIYENTTNSLQKEDNHFLQIVLEGDSLNKQAIGAKLQMETSQGIITHEQYPSRGFMSSISPVITLGVGLDSTLSKIYVTWPDGTEEIITDVTTNQRLHIKKKGNPEYSVSENQTSRPTPMRLFRNRIISGLDYKHQEGYFNDFDRQPLLPHLLSRTGPSLAIGDLGQNGLDDFYIGGSQGTAGQLFLQQRDGTFLPKQLEDTLLYEDQGALFLDIDLDNDLDLYVVSGGVERGKKSQFYEDRLFVNQDNMNFKKTPLTLTRENGSCAIAADYDQDGDLDIFVGGASKPGEYPLAAKSLLLRNDTVRADQPVLTEIAESEIPDLANIGIVKSALWSDYDNDGWLDLLIVGEYTPLIIFKNQEGHLIRQQLSDSSSIKGLWNSINGADLDNDGNIDYILGNRGLNSRYKPTSDAPITIYAADFDGNGVIDPVMTKWVKGKEVPVHLRDDLFAQLNALKKTMLKYEEYAEAGIEDLLSRKELDKAYTVKWEYAQSVCLINQGNGSFVWKPLPREAQIAPIYGTHLNDFDGDGLLDILTIGNSYAPEVFTGWLDASVGRFLKGNGDGTFTAISPHESGFYIPGDTKALGKLRYRDTSFILLASINNDYLKAFETTPVPIIDVVPLKTGDQRITITYRDGRSTVRELYYGTGYYSQNSRYLPISDQLESITIVDFTGNSRQISFTKP